MSQPILTILDEIVLPALQRVLPHDPMVLVRLAQSPAAFVGPFASSDPVPESVQLDVEVSGEHFIQVIYDPETFISIDDSRNRLISDLADWVAESRFGWGQKRD